MATILSPRTISFDDSLGPSKETCNECQGERWISSPSRKRRKVNFDNCMVSSVRAIPNREESILPDEYWYSRHEINQCRQDIVAIVKARRKRSCLDAITNNHSNFRGFEDLLSPKRMEEKRRRKKLVIVKVLKEQYRQRLLKAVDPERLRRESELASKVSRDIAKLHGNVDAMEANGLL